MLGPRKEDIAENEARLRANEAQAALLHQQLADSQLMAPMDAVVRTRIMEPGEMASPQSPVFSLAITDPKWVRAYVSETDLGKLNYGMSAAVSVDSFPKRRFDGWIGFISPVAEFTPKAVQTEELRTSLVYEVRVFVKDPGDQLRLGMPASVFISPDQNARNGVPANNSMTLTNRPGKIAMMSAAEDRPALSGRALTKIFHRDGGEVVRALDDISLEVQSGTLAALVGPDGAGKTTLLRLAAGLMTVDAGELKVLGIDVSADPQQVQDRIGYMPQKFGLYEDLTVQENIDLYADLHGIDAADRAQRYPRLMEMTALGPFTQRLAGRLSGGMKQKLGLACTLVCAPELLLLDEPTVGVDPLSRRELWAIIFQLVHDEKLTVLLSTSYLDEAERCGHVVVMHHGKALAQGRPSEVSELAAGRVFLATPPAGCKAREFQARLLDRPDIVDAVPESGRVRFVRGPTDAQMDSSGRPRKAGRSRSWPRRGDAKRGGTAIRRWLHGFAAARERAAGERRRYDRQAIVEWFARWRSGSSARAGAPVRRLHRGRSH